MSTNRRQELVQLSRQIGIRHPENQTTAELVGGLKKFLKHSDTLMNQTGGGYGHEVLLSIGVQNLTSRKPLRRVTVEYNLNHYEPLTPHLVQEALDNLSFYWVDEIKPRIEGNIERWQQKISEDKRPEGMDDSNYALHQFNIKRFRRAIENWSISLENGEQKIRRELIALRKQLEQNPQSSDSEYTSSNEDVDVLPSTESPYNLRKRSRSQMQNGETQDYSSPAKRRNVNLRKRSRSQMQNGETQDYSRPTKRRIV